MNPMLERNLSFLPDGLLALLPSRPSPEIGIVRGEKEWPVARLIRNRQAFHSNSLMDPWKEAAAWADTLDYKDVFVSFIYGCGFGYPLLEYAKRRKDYTTTIIFEQNLDLFYAMLCAVDLEPLLKERNYHFVIGNPKQMKAQINEVFSADFLLYASKPATFFTWLAHRNEKSTYLSLHEWLFDNLELSLSNVGNSVHDNLVGMYNMLDNVQHVFGNPSASKLHHAYSGMPAVIVANGPSLDGNIGELHQAVGKAVILTAESALRPCLKRNIVPDAVCITERTPNTYKIHFEHKDYPAELAMIGLNVMDPRIPPAFQGKWVPIFRQFESTSQWINAAISDGLGFNGGSSSAHLAFEFALWLGCSPIILIGQDLAFGVGMTTHSKQSSYYTDQQMAEHMTVLQAQPKVMVKGNDGRMIPTIKVWYEFKTWFEQQIGQHPDSVFINATEGGAFIEGTELMTLREAIARYCTKEKPDKLIDRMKSSFSVDSREQITAKYHKLIDKIGQIRMLFLALADAAEQDIKNCKIVEKACELHMKYNGKLPAFIRELYASNLDGFRKFGSKAEVIAFMQSIIYSAYKRINDIGEADSGERLLEITGILKEMYELLQESCLQLERHFALARRRMEKQLQKIGGA